ncbi:MAG: SEC-C domain-containing protein [bacterium]|nr:SEC-C domain-containing protein [bacterium]
MSENSIVKQYGPLILSGGVTLLFLGLALTLTSMTVAGLGFLLSYVFQRVFHQEAMEVFHYVLVVLATACTAGLGIPILLLARNIQKSTEHFSLLQFEDEAEDDDEFDDAETDELDDGEELNEFLKKLHKTRNIGPFIPSPKTMDDLCPCGSGLKYKDCCGKFWV